MSVVISHRFERPVCGSCTTVVSDRPDDGDERPMGVLRDDERGREYDHRFPECYEAVVGEAEEAREWLATE